MQERTARRTSALLSFSRISKYAKQLKEMKEHEAPESHKLVTKELLLEICWKKLMLVKDINIFFKNWNC